MNNIAQILPMLMLKDASEETRKTGVVNMVLSSDQSSGPLANMLTFKKLAEIDEEYETLKTEYEKAVNVGAKLLEYITTLSPAPAGLNVATSTEVKRKTAVSILGSDSSSGIDASAINASLA
jgi:hypothetical protein